VLPGLAHVSGWAYCTRAPVETVVVLVDGAPRACASLGGPRADVAVAFGHAPGSARAGWSAKLELADRAGARVAVSALAVTADGLVERLGAVELDVMAGEARIGAIESPVSGTVVNGDVLTIQGWALPSDRLARVEVSVGGHARTLARPMALPRPDLTQSAVAVAPLAGFVHTVDLSDREAGESLPIACEVVTSRGDRTFIGSLEVRVGERLAKAVVPTQVRSLQARVADACARPAAVSSPAVRLLVVTHRLDLGGAQLYLLELLAWLLIELDISCLVVAAHDGPLRGKLEDLGASVHIFDDFPAASPEQYETTLLELASLAREHGCNVAVVNTMGAAIGADLAGRLGMPAVWAIHESYTLGEYFLAAFGPNGIHPYVRDRMVAALGHTAALVFEAHSTRAQYALYGDPRRFITVPYGITVADVEKYRATTIRDDLRRAASIDDETTVLLCMGTFEPRKAQGALVAAFAELTQEFPDTLLVLVGDVGGAYADAVHEVADRLALGDRVRFLPVVDEPYGWYAIADVLVSASDVESLPRSVLEAMAFHLPVVAASVFGLPELIEDGVTGMLFAPRDLDALVAGVRRALAASPAVLAEQAAAAAELVRTRYDSSGYAGAYRALLRGLLANPAARPDEILPT
jgi:glycosyltransferase involved in cell wall biosynthesis